MSHSRAKQSRAKQYKNYARNYSGDRFAGKATGLGLPLLLFLLTLAYFGRGLSVSYKHQQELSLDTQKAELARHQINLRHEQLQNQHFALSGNAPDLDLVKELLRSQLGWVEQDELVVLIPD